MSGRVNHRGWIVIESVASADASLCVDFFEHPDGGFGFEHFRSDPEDQGRWTKIGNHSTTRFKTVEAAKTAALDAISWLQR